MKLVVKSYISKQTMVESDQEEQREKKITEIKTFDVPFGLLEIKEGMNIYQLNELIEKSYLINDCNMLKCIKSNFNFKEGILYPDTYYYKKSMLASIIIQKSHDTMQIHLNEIF